MRGPQGALKINGIFGLIQVVLPNGNTPLAPQYTPGESLTRPNNRLSCLSKTRKLCGIDIAVYEFLLTIPVEFTLRGNCPDNCSQLVYLQNCGGTCCCQLHWDIYADGTAASVSYLNSHVSFPVKAFYKVLCNEPWHTYL